MRVAPPCIDKRNKIQRSLDDSVRKLHREFGDEMEGYVLIVYGEDLSQPRVHIHGDLEMDSIPTYAEAVTQWAVDLTKESMG